MSPATADEGAHRRSGAHCAQEDVWVDEVMETQAELYDRIDAELVGASKSK